MYELEQLGAPVPQNTDDAISDLTDDKLNRGKFVKELARTISRECPPVLALVGPYGAGKTSILNMLAEVMSKTRRDEESGTVAVVQFKTWLPGDEKTLIFTLLNSIAQTLQPRVATNQLRRRLNKYARIIVGLIPHASGSLVDFFRDPSQEEELKRINRALEALPIRRAVLLLDDIDRMQPRELEALLKLIRAAGNYPKLTFVCAFHKAALARILAGWGSTHDVHLDLLSTNQAAWAATVSGQITPSSEPAIYGYLEKFFPIQIPVPKIDEAILAKLFNEEFKRFCVRNALLTTEDEQETFNKKFKPVWDGYFKHALDNPRKLNDYFNALRWSFPHIKREVNLFDYMVLELLRETEPSAYEQLFFNRKYFYYPEWEVMKWPERLVGDERLPPEEQQAYELVLRGLYGSRREFAVGLLRSLFPRFYANKAEARLGRHKANELEAERERKIYHPAFFTIYFSFQVPEQYFGGEELDRLAESLNSIASEEGVTKNFESYFGRFDELKRINMLDRLLLFEKQLSPIVARGIAFALAKGSLRLAPDFLSLGERASALRFVIKIASRFQDSEEITTFLKALILSSESDGFARDLWILGTMKERNDVFTNWDNVKSEAIKAAFLERMRSRYFAGSANSIYAGRIEDFSSLFAWANTGADDLKSVQDYLRVEFQNRPSSVGTHVRWILPSIMQNADSRVAADKVFPFEDIKILLQQKGEAACASKEDRQAVEKFLEFLSSPQNQNPRSSVDPESPPSSENEGGTDQTFH